MPCSQLQDWSLRIRVLSWLDTGVLSLSSLRTPDIENEEVSMTRLIQPSPLIVNNPLYTSIPDRLEEPLLNSTQALL